MDERPNIYAVPGIPYQVIFKKKRLAQAIAEVWGIPEDKVLGSTLVVDKKHPSPESARGERVKTPGERKVAYVNARKFYFYVLFEIKHYPYKELTKITGRRIAAIDYYVAKAIEHMEREKSFLTKANMVLDMITNDQIIFPTPIIIYEANAKVIDGRGLHEDSLQVQLPEAGQRCPDKDDNTDAQGVGTTENAD